MGINKMFKFLILLVTVVRVKCDILCQADTCMTYLTEVGCAAAAVHCRINNATYTGLTMLSPTICNCCEYCLPLYGEGEYCSTGGPGAGTTVGRCGDGLSCTANDDEHSTCLRMSSDCHTAQDDYDSREVLGEIGALEHRPYCDGKGRYAAHYCIPTLTCFCQSDKGERLFGEALNLGTVTTQNMNCGCSRFHQLIKTNISPSVKLPVLGPRCTSNGNFNPIQCIDRVCYCVDTTSGRVLGEEKVDLDEEPISELSCYNSDLDLYPQYSEGSPPYNYTTPCLEDMREKIELILKSEEDGYNVDYFSAFPECQPDGSFGAIAFIRSGSKVCVDDRGHRLGDYEAASSDVGFSTMDCKCARTTHIMGSALEKPICCKNGNFRRIQCRRGLCRCVDTDGRQTEREAKDITTLSCYTEDWKTC